MEAMTLETTHPDDDRNGWLRGLEAHNPNVPPSLGNSYDYGHAIAAEAGVAENELPERCLQNPYFMLGFRDGMTARDVDFITECVAPFHDRGDDPDIDNILACNLENLDAELLRALAAALKA
jgi:hypothetical protein